MPIVKQKKDTLKKEIPQSSELKKSPEQKASNAYNWLFYGLLILLAVFLFFFLIRNNKKNKAINVEPTPIEDIFTGDMDMFSGSSSEVKDALYAGNIGSTNFGFTPTQILLLEKTYQQDGDIEVANSLLRFYLSRDRFSDAYNLLQKVKDKKDIGKISEEVVGFITFNNALSNPTDAQTTRLELTNSNEGHMYRLLYALADKNYQEFDTLLAEASNSDVAKQNPLIGAFLQDRQTYRTLKDSPSYYFSGLLAVSLMQGGYSPLATILAEDALSQDDTYILGYELLSQIAIKQERYQDAVEYLDELMKLDTQHVTRTAFYLGISHYYLNSSAKAAVYFNQVRDPQYLYDAVRYLILINGNLKNYDEMLNQFRILLAEKQVEKQDYALLFDTLFYEPYRSGGSGADFSLAKKNLLSVVVPYIDECNKNLSESDSYICKYGEAGWYLSQNQAGKALKDLLYLSRVYPQPMIYQALGDYYGVQNDTQRANLYYARALQLDARQ